MGAILACVGLALLAGGCNPNERAFFREGIGTELYSADALPATDLQNIYLDHLCRQSAPFVGPNVPSCSQQELPPSAWALIVQAGMNDIDARCDAYLAWLDQKKRENAAILAEIGAIRVAVDALTNPGISPGISPTTLAAVAAAFGLATNTLANVNSLLLTVDHTTVQSVVFINRRDFRVTTTNLQITNKPAAVHVLRSYLQICMPMTISANINSTVTVFQTTGPGVMGKRPLVETPIPVGGAPARPRDEAGQRPDRPKISEIPGARTVFVDYNTNDFPTSVVRRLQNVLCVPSGEVGNIGQTTAHHIAIFEASPIDVADRRLVRRDGMIDLNERDILQKSMGCQRARVRNFYERTVFADGAAANLSERVNAFVIDRLNKVRIPNTQPLARGTSLDDARPRIKAVRAALMASPDTAGQLRALPDSMQNQWTIDLFELLTRMPAQQ
jgi:hypothetical protein